METLTLGERLKELRNLFGLSQVEISQRLGITRSLYCCYEINRETPEENILNQLAKLYHVSPNYLLVGEPEEDYIQAKKASIKLVNDLKEKGMIRKIDTAGRVVIPKKILNILGLQSEDEIKISIQNGKIVIEEITEK